MEKTKPRVNIAHFVLAFMGVYISGYILLNITGSINHKYLVAQIYFFIVFAIIFAYGLISLIHDIKNGGIRLVIEKIRRVLSGK